MLHLCCLLLLCRGRQASVHSLHRHMQIFSKKKKRRETHADAVRRTGIRVVRKEGGQQDGRRTRRCSVQTRKGHGMA